MLQQLIEFGYHCIVTLYFTIQMKRAMMDSIQTLKTLEALKIKGNLEIYTN